MATTLTRRTAGESRTLLAWSALLVVWVVWGSTYLAIRVGVRTMPPFTMAAIRYLIAGAILVPIGWRSGTAEQRVTDRPGVRQWGAMLLLGAMLPAFGNGVVSWAELRLPSGIAALLVATVPLWMVVADSVLARRLPGVTRWAALVIGLIGVAVLSGVGGASSLPLAGTFAVLFASLSWGTGSALQGRLPIPARPLLMAGMEMLCGGVVCAVIAAVRGETVDLGAVNADTWWAIAYLIGPGSLLAMTCYVFALGRLSATTVSTYAFVNPVVALFLGALLLNETLSGREALGAVIIVLAVAGLLVGRRATPRL